MTKIVQICLQWQSSDVGEWTALPGNLLFFRCTTDYTMQSFHRAANGICGKSVD